jgi:NACalpha-BTF3-like transcription factor
MANAAQTASQLDSVTDHVVEKDGDEAKGKAALAELQAVESSQRAEKQQREKELAAVKVNKDDIEVLVKELDMDKKKAERALRENGGDLAKTIASLVSA